MLLLNALASLSLPVELRARDATPGSESLTLAAADGCCAQESFDSVPSAMYFLAVFLGGEWGLTDFSVPGKVLCIMLVAIGIQVITPFSLLLARPFYSILLALPPPPSLACSLGRSSLAGQGLFWAGHMGVRLRASQTLKACAQLYAIPISVLFDAFQEVLDDEGQGDGEEVRADPRANTTSPRNSWGELRWFLVSGCGAYEQCSPCRHRPLPSTCLALHSEGV